MWAAYRDREVTVISDRSHRSYNLTFFCTPLKETNNNAWETLKREHFLEFCITKHDQNLEKLVAYYISKGFAVALNLLASHWPRK